jgi:hypothetical protein
MNPEGWLSQLRRRFEKVLSGSAPSDPLYLSNRTWKQKLRLASLIAAPVVLLGVIILVGSTDMLHLIKSDPYEHNLKQTAPVRTAALPDPKLTPKDLDVVDLRIVRDKTPVITGLVRNNTDRAVGSVEVSYYLADGAGSLMGSESTAVENLQPHASVPFRTPLKTLNAQFVLVRDVHAN